MNQLRPKRRLLLEPLQDETVDQSWIRPPDPDQLLPEPVFDDPVRAALAALHPDLRIAVLIHDVNGLTYEEIGAALGVKRGTIGSRIHRGRAQLRSVLAHRAPRTCGSATVVAVRRAA